MGIIETLEAGAIVCLVMVMDIVSQIWDIHRDTSFANFWTIFFIYCTWRAITYAVLYIHPLSGKEQPGFKVRDHLSTNVAVSGPLKRHGLKYFPLWLCPACKEMTCALHALANERVVLSSKYHLLITLLDNHDLIEPIWHSNHSFTDLICDDIHSMESIRNKMHSVGPVCADAPLIALFRNIFTTRQQCCYSYQHPFELYQLEYRWKYITPQARFESTATNVIEVLVDHQGNDPQAIIDVIHEVRLHTFSSLKSR